MHRTDGADHAANLFKSTPAPPTQVDKDWLNAIQEELCNFIEGLGVVLVKGTNTQLRDGVGVDGANGKMFQARLPLAGGLGLLSRVYVKPSAALDESEFWVVVGASYDLAAQEWTADNPGGEVFAFRIDPTGVSILYATTPTTDAEWTDADWELRSVAGPAGNVSYGGAGGSDTVGVGLKGIATTANGAGLRGEGFGVGKGVIGKGGATGAGVNGIGGATSGAGVRGDCQKNSNAVEGVVDNGAGGTGAGGYFVGGDEGYGLVAQSGRLVNPVRAAIRCPPVNANPTSPSEGDMSVMGTPPKLYMYSGGAWGLVSAQ